jgi:NAD(P)-dependent dehydrogenase (short-subunit alcohol dehydrogenase family)
MNSPSLQRFVGKTALVTGAASGIGRAVAQRLTAEGARVALADLDQAGAARIAEAIDASGAQVIALQLDVQSEADWQAAVERIPAEWGPLRVCVNNAGIAWATPITELELADWRRVLTTNLDGVFLGTRLAMRLMKAGGGGCIVNVASAAGIKPLAGNAAYGTSKAAIRFFTRVAALEAAAYSVRVNSISPGAVATPMWESTDLWPREIAATGGRRAALKALVTDHGFAEPEQIAAAVLFLASDEARNVTGVDLPIDDGFPNS